MKLTAQQGESSLDVNRSQVPHLHPRSLRMKMECLQIFSVILGLCFFPVTAALAQQACRKVVFKAAVNKGDTFQKAISPKLAFVLKPTASGWQIEMQPPDSPPPHDAAEVATPPYESINPLLLTTDYGMRAQDAVAWNPRPFEFATGGATGLLASHDLDIELDKSPSADDKLKKVAEMRLIALAMNSAHGELRILDASLVPGTADQSAAAATVASHWRTTPHTLVQPTAGSQATALGSLQSLRVQVTLWMPRSVTLVPGLHPVPVSCPQ